MENILTNPACGNQTESPLRHVTLLQGCEMCFQEPERRKRHPCFRHAQQHQQHLKRSEAPKLHPAFTPSSLDSCEKCAFRVWEELKLESPAVLSSADHKQPQHGCRPEDQNLLSSAQILVWPAWADTGFTGLSFDDEVSRSSSFCPSLDEMMCRVWDVYSSEVRSDFRSFKLFI